MSIAHIRNFRLEIPVLNFRFQVNTGLIRVNLSWNGFHLDGSKAVRSMLGENKTITELDLSCNRLDMECLREIIKGLSKNTTLSCLKVRRGLERFIVRRHII